MLRHGGRYVQRSSHPELARISLIHPCEYCTDLHYNCQGEISPENARRARAQRAQPRGGETVGRGVPYPASHTVTVLPMAEAMRAPSGAQATKTGAPLVSP